MRRPPAIDFYLYATHEVETWLPIVTKLRARGADARFVLERPGRNLTRGAVPDPMQGWRTEPSGLKEPLVDQSVYASLQTLLAEHGETPLERRRRNAPVAVTTQSARWLRVYSGARVRCMYGVGFVRDAYGHGSINAGFDLILAHGPYSAAEITRVLPSARIVQVGYPKWAAYRRDEVTIDLALRALELDERPLAWLPTWAANSSLDEYLEPIAAMARTRPVVMKPHHNNVRFEQERLDRAARAGVRILPTDTSLVHLLAASAAVICDPRSGAFTEAILADRPAIVVLSGGGESALHQGALECATVCERPENLDDAVQRAMCDPHAAGRRRWREDLFTDHEGHDDDVAAAALLDVAIRTWPTRRVSSLLWSAIYSAARRVGR